MKVEKLKLTTFEALDQNDWFKQSETKIDLFINREHKDDIDQKHIIKMRYCFASLFYKLSVYLKYIF